MKHTAMPFAIVATACGAGLLAGSSVVSSAWAQGHDSYQALDTLARAMTAVEAHHVQAVSSDQLIHAAIHGIADSLDRHSIYLDPDQWRALQQRNEGRWFGIGVELRIDPLGARVASVVDASPADLSGLQADDILMSADGVSLEGLGLSEVGEALDGDRGEAVRLQLRRGEQTLTKAVVRDQVIAPVVHAELVEPGQAYVRIDHFRQRTGAELATALSALADQGGKPLDGVVLDLRGNPGGLLDEAVGIVDLFVSDGLIVETRNREGEQVEAHRAGPGGTLASTDIDASLAVLIDGGSASASEIVAGALQDLHRATIVGSPSYGKGSVQQVYEFEDGSALKLTVARYYLASGRTFDTGDGLTPDVIIPRTDQLTAAQAHLRRALEQLGPDQAEPLQRDLDLLLTLAPSSPLETPVPHSGNLDDRLRQDPQLRSACQQVRATR